MNRSIGTTTNSRYRSETMEWHSVEAKEDLSHLHVNVEKGLSTQEAEERLHKHGLNEIQRQKGPSVLRIIVSQFTSPLIWLLLAAVIISAVLGEFIDAFVILAIVIVNSILGFVQEYRAERSIEAMRKLAAPRTKVLRNGKMDEIDSKYIVPGDIIFVETGDKCPADARLVSVSNLETQESVLTGESTPIDKEVSIVSKATLTADQKNMIFAGTTVTRGRATAVVTSTGQMTEFWKIAEMIKKEPETVTPLQKKFEHIARLMTGVAAVIIVLTVALGLLRGQDTVTIFIIAVSLAVAAVPEGLPAVITISLAMGVQRMAKRNALIRKLPSAETLGSVSVICTDKTGTLTHNEMTVRYLWTAGSAAVKITGSGYMPTGSFEKGGQQLNILENKDAELLLTSGFLCNNTVVKRDNHVMKAIGDPTEAALIVAAEKAGLTSQLSRKYPRKLEIEFSSERKRMTTVHLVGGKEIAFTKGAVDVLLDHCGHISVN